MPQLIKNREVVDDRWTLVREITALADLPASGAQIIPLAFWLEHPTVACSPPPLDSRVAPSRVRVSARRWLSRVLVPWSIRPTARPPVPALRLVQSAA